MPAVAGAFYPDDADELRKMLAGFSDKAANDKSAKLPKGKLKGIIVPHAGYIYSGPVAAYAYNLFKTLKKSDIPEKIIIIGPSHYASFPGIAESGYAAWRTPLGDVGSFSIRDRENAADINVYPAVHGPEHSVEVQLPFLQVALEGKRFQVDPIVTGETEPRSAAALLSKPVDDCFLVVSSDLSHYMPYQEAIERDKRTLSLINSMDVDAFAMNGDACGRSGISIAIALAKKKGWRFQLLKYANSGDTAGPKTEVVGYAALAIMEGI